MAIQTLRRDTLASGLGGGLAQGLESLAQERMARLQRQRSMAGLEEAGLSPQAAKSVALSDPGIQQQILKEYFRRPGIGEALGNIIGLAPRSPLFQQMTGQQQPGGMPGLQQQSRVPQAAPRSDQEIEQSADRAQDIASRELSQDIAGEEAPKLLKDPYVGGGLYQAGKGALDFMGKLLRGQDEGFAGVPDFAYQKPGFKKDLQQYEKSLHEGALKDLDAITDFEKIQATNPVSKTLQLASSNAPWMLLGGGGLLSKLASNIGSAAGVVAAEEAGGGTWSQLGGSILGSMAPGIAGRQAAKIVSKGLSGMGFKDAAKAFEGKSLAEIPKFKKELYETEKELGSSIKLSTRPMMNKLDNLATKVQETPVSGPRFSLNDQNALLADIKNTQSAITGPGFESTASNISQRIKDLNKNFIPGKGPKANYYRDIVNVLKDQLKETATKNPVWGEAWKTANQLHQIDNWKTPLSNMLSNTKINWGQYPGAALTLKMLGISLPKAALGAAFASLPLKGADMSGRALKRLNALYQSDAGSKLLSNLVAKSAQGNVEGMKIALEQLGKLSNKFLGEKDGRNNV